MNDNYIYGELGFSIIGITLEGKALKDNYIAGQTFNPEGITVYAVYENGIKMKINNLNCDWVDSVTLNKKLNIGTEGVLCRYLYFQAEYQYPIYVSYEISPDSISLEYDPSRGVYIINTSTPFVLSSVEGNTEVADLCQSLEIKGKSQVFNQYCGQETYNTSINSYGSYDNINNKIIFNVSKININTSIFSIPNIPLNHKILLRFILNGQITYGEKGSSCQVGLYFENTEGSNSWINNGYKVIGVSNETVTYNNEEYSLITSDNTNICNSVYFFMYGEGNSIDTETTIQCQIFDLTLMGIADEVNSLEDFKSKFPNEYYSYNAGTIYSVDFDKISTYNEDEEEKSIVLDNNIELNSALEVNDSLIASGDTLGTLTKIKRVEKVVLDGSEDENWLQYPNQLERPAGAYCYYTIISTETPALMKYNTSICNNFNNYVRAWVSGNIGDYSDYVGTTNYKYFVTDKSTLEEWKNYLKNNPIILIQQLQTPVIESISATSTILTKEEKEQVKNININNTNLDYVTNENNVNLGVLKNSYFGGIKPVATSEVDLEMPVIFSLDSQELKGAQLVKDKLLITKNEDNNLYTMKKIINMKAVNLADCPINYNSSTATNSFYAVVNDCQDIKSYTGINTYFKIEGNLIKNVGTNNSTSNVVFSTYNSYSSIEELKANLNTVLLLYPLVTPIEEIVSNSLTYEDISVLANLVGDIYIEGNTNEQYTHPDIKINSNIVNTNS